MKPNSFKFKLIFLKGNACDSGPCLNGGTCVPNSYNNYQCSCSVEFSGQNCETGKTSKFLIKIIHQSAIFLFAKNYLL